MKHGNALLTSLASLWIATGAWAQAPEDAPDAEQAQDWTIAVVHLDYADAQEVADVLSQVLPPSVRVVPYYQTNSLIISGDPAIVARLVDDDDDDGAPAPGETDTTGTDPADSVPASGDNIIAQAQQTR